VLQMQTVERQRRALSYRVVRLRQMLTQLRPDSRIYVNEAGLLRSFSGESQYCTFMQESGPGSRKLKPNDTLLARYALVLVEVELYCRSHRSVSLSRNTSHSLTREYLCFVRKNRDMIQCSRKIDDLFGKAVCQSD